MCPGRTRLLATGAACVLMAYGAAARQAPEPRDAVGSQPSVPVSFGPVDLSAPLPDEDNAWVVIAVTRGGLAGGTAGTIVVDSRGQVTCANAAARCPERLADGALEPLKRAVASAAARAWTGSLSTCSDCSRTLLVLRRRRPDGTVAVHTAFWDVTTQANVASDVRHVYSTAVALGR